MPESNQIGRNFYAQHCLEAARQLLGTRLVRLEGEGLNTVRTAGIIVETEAYRGQEDLGCHARAGVTPRTQVMYGPPGHAYVYFTYGMHWMLNFVVEAEGFPAAVLVRAIWPTEGIERMAARRPGRARSQWTNGPGKLCQALAIDGSFNGKDLCEPGAALFVESGIEVPEESVTNGPRVGLNSVPEPWKSIPWRFLVKPVDIPALLSAICPIQLED